MIVAAVVAVVPVKDLAQAKRRLDPVLSATERVGLVRAMLADVLAAFTRTRGLASVHVVTRDAEVAEIARAHGAAVIPEAENRGYDAAVARAVAHLAGQATAILAVPGDVPLVRADELEALARPVAGPLVRLAPSRDGDGSNGLLLCPPGVITTRYGPGSAARHRRAAAEAGVVCEELALPGLAFDIDTPQDLADFCATASRTGSRAFLERTGVLARLLESGRP